jgi:hypothetical protein
LLTTILKSLCEDRLDQADLRNRFLLSVREGDRFLRNGSHGFRRPKDMYFILFKASMDAPPPVAVSHQNRDFVWGRKEG